MNAKTGKSMILAVVVLIGCLHFLEQSALAQSTNNCMKVKGTATDFITGGTITHGGILNGTTQFAITSGFIPGPTPTTVSFTADYTITTNRGELRAHSVYIYDFGALVATAFSRIDPDTSTGVFAGATGLLYFNAKSTDGGVSVESDITSEICFAN